MNRHILLYAYKKHANLAESLSKKTDQMLGYYCFDEIDRSIHLTACELNCARRILKLIKNERA